MQSTIGLDKTKELVRDAVKRYPNRINPTRGFGGGCAYTSKNGKTHCIAGQVFADLGLPVPPHDYYGAVDDLVEVVPETVERFSPEALDYLLGAQSIFDGGFWSSKEEPRKHVAPRKWSTALKLLEKATEEANDG